ncbi:hypothetical protein [Marinomonas sp. S3726]|uniref:hypothetical protein n=1 Tax=Marinomonas sp. S3726 TaxID=579484 RepID=UPI000AF89FDF|nr:hypothetical protein [Marinomonas sp. S3726]
MNNLLGFVMGDFLFKALTKSQLNQTFKKNVFYTLVCVALLQPSFSLFASSINDERLLKSLIDRGIICAELSPSEQQQALQNYLQKKMQKKAHNKPAKTAPDTQAKTACQPVPEQVSPKKLN